MQNVAFICTFLGRGKEGLSLIVLIRKVVCWEKFEFKLRLQFKEVGRVGIKGKGNLGKITMQAEAQICEITMCI